jgi:hypothetical protein
MAEEKNTYLHIGKRIAKIKQTDWDYEFDPDKVFKIDPFNIFGEIITIPVFVNRLGVICAEMRSYVKEQKLRYQVKEAEVRKLFLNKESGDGKKKPTLQQIDDHVLLDPVVKNLKFKYFKIEEDLERLESMYEAARDKSFKLNNIAKNLKPEDFEKEIIEGTINGVMVELKDKRYAK